MNERLAFALTDLRVPMEPDTLSHHWKHPEMQWDVMQPQAFIFSVLTGVTIGALADLGHVVDMTKAEEILEPYKATKLTLGHSYCNGVKNFVIHP